MAVTLFGFTIGKKEDQKKIPKEVTNKSFVIPTNDDGAVTIQSGAYYGTYVDLDGIVRNEVELITRYREMSMQPELEKAIDEIVNASIIMEDSGHSIDINMDDLEQPESIKKKIKDEFDFALKLLNFNNKGYEVFRRWYIDGRMFYHVIVDETALKQGIKELRYIDPRRIRKIREIQKTKDPATGMEIVKKQNEYYLYNERGVIGTHSNLGTKITVDSVININSGLMDSKRAMVLSYLHKAIKPLNQLRMMEDATVIYRLSRAPERRIFYIDVGNMSTINAERYVRDIMVKYRNKLVYDSSTGEIRDDRRHLSMLEDFWLPRREGSQGTKIDTLPGGQNLGQMEDVDYFNKKLYEAMGVPLSRLQPQQGFSLSKTAEINRDEMTFSKFIQKLRGNFSELFDEILMRQLTMKGICSREEWDEFKEYIWYEYKQDVDFNEIKESELLTNRITLLSAVDPFVGRYYSVEWVRKHVLRLTDDEIEEIDKQIADEMKMGKIVDPNAPPPGMDANGNPIPMDQNGQVVPTPQGMGGGQSPPAPQGKNSAPPSRFANDTMDKVR